MHQSGCPIAFALDIFGDKWSLLILRDIILLNKRFYKEFMSAGEGISTNILADRLQKLEDAGIIRKERDTEDKKRFIYRATDKGLDLIPLLFAMIEWSGKYDPNTVAAKEFLDNLRRDSKRMEQQLRARHQKHDRS